MFRKEAIWERNKRKGREQKEIFMRIEGNIYEEQEKKYN